MSDRSVRIKFTIDVTPVVEAFRQLARTVGTAVDSWVALLRGWLVDPRAKYGWQTNRAGAWISPICAAWVHEGCPLPDYCGCTSRACDHRATS